MNYDNSDSFPRLQARTLNFQLGHPRAFTVSPDGSRVAFLRSDSGTSRVHSLWVYDLAAGTERLVADAASLLDGAPESLTAEEKARRERTRTRTVGITTFSTDHDVTVAAFALGSGLFVADLAGSAPVQQIPTDASVLDPHMDPTGQAVAYADGRALHVIDQTGRDRILVGPEPDEPAEVVWGLAEFIAGEEMDRARGFWWAPDGRSLLVERYDESAVDMWYVGDPAHPDQPPTAQRYPRAGSANAVVSLTVVPLDGTTNGQVAVDWQSDADTDGQRLEYLAQVTWKDARPVLTLLTRDQRRMEFREVDPDTGKTSLMRAITDDRWVEPMPGTPRMLTGGGLLHGLDRGDTRHLAVDGQPFTPEGLQVRVVEAVEADGVVASVVPAVGSVALARLGFDGSVELLSEQWGSATGAVGGPVTVIAQRVLTDPTVEFGVRRDGHPAGVLSSRAQRPPLTLNLQSMPTGSRGFATTVLFPTWHQPGSQRLPVLMDPYGGPHGQRVVNSADAYFTPQWFADQGFAVVVADGRGTPGRGGEWDRLVKGDFAATIDDQVDVIGDLVQRYPQDLDASRIGIRGWSFGGYLAALAVLKRPDVFGAAVAGAPVTEWRLYDTCYTERYLGHPDEAAQVYDANSLLPLAPGLSRPLLLIHGLADDNVAAAHTLRLSGALLAAGRAHEVLPLSGMTHMADDDVVTENLLLLQLDFLRRALSAMA